MINRVWPQGSAKSPSQLRELACASPKNVTSESNSNDLMPLSEPTSDDPGAIDGIPPADPTAVVQSSASTITDAAVVPPADSASVVNNSALALPDTNVAVNYNGTLEHIESAGMVIDLDFMRYLTEDTHLTSVRNCFSR